MMIEYRAKGDRKVWFNDNSIEWLPLHFDMNWKDFNWDFYSVRINKDRQYHRGDTKGCREVFEKAQAWNKLADINKDAW